MVKFYTTKDYRPGITAIEGSIAIGWPYHGVLKTDYNESYYSGRAIIGHEDIPHEYLRGIPNRNFRYPVEVANQPDDWSHFMLSGNNDNRNIFIDGDDGDDGHYMEVSSGQIRLGELHLGLPLQAPSGRYLNFSAHVASAGDALVVCTYPDYADGRNADTHPNVAHSINIDISSAKSYASYGGYRGGGSFDQAMVPLSSATRKIVFESEILDYKKDRVLVGVYPVVTGDGAIYYDDTLAGRIIPRWFRYELTGNSAYTRLESGDQLVAIYEVVLTGETARDVEVTQLKSPLDCEGTVSRSSPSSTTKIPLGTDGSGMRETYEWSVSQNGAIIDAYYKGDDSIEFITYSVAHSYSGWTSRVSDHRGTRHEDSSEINSLISCRGVTKTYRQILTRETEYPDGDMPFANDNIIIRNRIWVDGEGSPTIDESFVSSENNNATVTPLTLRQLSGERAPYPGLEARCAVFGTGFGIPAYHNVFNMHVYSMALRNNGNGGCVLYGVIDTFGIHPDLVNTKTVSDCHLFSKKGDLVIAGFTEHVQFDDPRYGDQFTSTPYSKFRGYVGARLKAGINLHSGEFYEASLDEPLAKYCWV